MGVGWGDRSRYCPPLPPNRKRRNHPWGLALSHLENPEGLRYPSPHLSLRLFKYSYQLWPKIPVTME